MKKEEITAENKKIQALLNKLMSEEMLAHMFYMGCIVATCHCKSDIFAKLFVEIANDELEDHFMHMKDWALANNYTVPFKMKEYTKFAENDTKRLDTLKKDKEAIYYVEEAIQAERDAIISYDEAMKNDIVPYDLNAVLMQNYYDECEHLEKLTMLKYALEANVDLAAY